MLLVWGYGQARLDPVVLWNPPLWMRYVAALLTLPAFVLVVAGNMRGTRMKAALGHPMVLGVKLWAFAHLIANGTLAAAVLFGSFLVWAIVDFASLRRRDPRSEPSIRRGRFGATRWLRQSAWPRGSRSRSGCTACSSACGRSDEHFASGVVA